MPDLESIAGNVRQFAPEFHLGTDFKELKPQGITVHFTDDQTVRLSPDDPRWALRAEILYELWRIRAPVYVEADRETGTIDRLLIPREAVVESITPLDSGDLHVELAASPTRRILRRADRNFGRWMEILQASRDQGVPAIVTDTENDHEIIHARLAPSPFYLPVCRPPQENRDNRPLALRTVTPQRAQELFEKLSSCDAQGEPASCIPFLYPDDGCTGRAHEVCRLLMAEGEQPGKVWNYGFLEADTPNHPDCEVCWDWHVAPTLAVEVGGRIELRVIDPALFRTGPVPLATWKDRQEDPDARHFETEAAIFYRRKNGATETDPTHERTGQELALFRLKLKKRTDHSGAPPYSDCL